MKSLVIAEKPSVARDIARVLHCNQKGNGVLEGKDYAVTWALGHLITLADPEEYDKKYMKWEMQTLPVMPDKMKLVVIRQTSKQYQAVKTQLFRKDIGDIIIATDAGREGELVARWILDKAGCRKPIRRLWISSVTDKAIRDGFQNLKDGKEYNNLYRAAVARAEADWLVGINGTRALTCKYNAQLSCGRVQTPTLAIIAMREEEIRNFKPKDYFGISVQAGEVQWTWKDTRSGSFRTFQKEKAEEIQRTVQNGQMEITSVVKKPKKTMAPGLYDLTTLQREANQKYGFSAKETLNIMQRLYENHKVLTYPRTDSRYIGKDVVPTIKERLKACGTGPYRKLSGALLSKPIHTNGSFVDDKKVSDHHAIIPTEQYASLTSFSSDERKIYDMVVARFLAVLSAPAISEQLSVKASINGELFRAKAENIKQLGWRELYEEETQTKDTIKAGNIPVKGKEYPVGTISMTEGTTNPPGRYTEGTLIDQMDKKGLGTVATRADIIDKLFNSYLLEKKGNEIHITSKGKQLLELVPEDLKKAELTADWEKKLTAISKGKQNDQKFMREISDYTQALINDIKTSDGKFRHDNVTRHRCPECGKFLLEVNGKHGKRLVCQDRTCGYKKTISRITNARCPVCHKKMEMVGEGEGQKFVCVCGYKEKLSAFKQRKEKQGSGMSKKEVNRYLKKQQKEAQEPINNAFAEAFSKIKL